MSDHSQCEANSKYEPSPICPRCLLIAMMENTKGPEQSHRILGAVFGDDLAFDLLAWLKDEGAAEFHSDSDHAAEAAN